MWVGLLRKEFLEPRFEFVDGQLLRRFPGVTTDAIGKLALIKDDETVHTYAANVGKVVCGRITSILTEGLEVFVDFSDRPSRVASNLYE